MSVAAELLSQNLPLASQEIAGISPAYLIGAAAVAGAAYQVKKIIPTWHHTINEGELGVKLYKGNPVERDLTPEQIAAGESKYAFPPDFYWIWPRHTMQTVYVTDQLNHIKFPLESSDDPKVQVHVVANVTWNVSPDGENPVRSITKVMHQKVDKKESTPTPSEDENRQVLKNRVLGICGQALGQTLTGRRAEELFTLNVDGPEEVREDTIERSREKLIGYGVLLTEVELLPVTRTGEQVLADAVRASQSLSSATAALMLMIEKGMTFGDGHLDENGLIKNGNGDPQKVVPLHASDPAAVVTQHG